MNLPSHSSWWPKNSALLVRTLKKEQAITDFEITQPMVREKYKREGKLIKLDEQLEEIPSLLMLLLLLMWSDGF